MRWLIPLLLAASPVLASEDIPDQYPGSPLYSKPVEVIPHVWGKHKDRDAPGKPYITEIIDDFTWKCEYMHGQGITSVNLWITGNDTTDPGGREQMQPYHDIVEGIFGDAA